MLKKYKTSDQLIAYFDILGYSSKVESGKINESEFIKSIIDMANLIKDMTIINNPFMTDNVKIYSFSDNFSICIETELEFKTIIQMRFLVQIIQVLQLKLITEHNIFIRGGITCGELYTDENIIYGKALINAHNIEEKISIYPRIVIDTELMDWAISFTKEFYEDEYDDSKTEFINCRNIFHIYEQTFFDSVRKSNSFQDNDPIWNKIEKKKSDSKYVTIIRDFDDLYFVDFLNFIPNIIENESYFIFSFFAIITHIFCELKKNVNNQSIIIKYIWMCSYINNYCFENNYKQPFTENTILKKVNIKETDILNNIIHKEQINTTDLNNTVYQIANNYDDFFLKMAESIDYCFDILNEEYDYNEEEEELPFN